MVPRPASPSPPRTATLCLCSLKPHQATSRNRPQLQTSRAWLALFSTAILINLRQPPIHLPRCRLLPPCARIPHPPDRSFLAGPAPSQSEGAKNERAQTPPWRACTPTSTSRCPGHTGTTTVSTSAGACWKTTRSCARSVKQLQSQNA